MDELKNNTQEAQEALEAQKALKLQEGLEALQEAAKSLKGYPFIVEITAAILIDNCGKKEAKERTEDPDLANNIFVLIDQVKSMSQELSKKDPAYAARSSSFMLKYYEKIPGYKPELDPESPSFNAEQYNAAVEEMGADRFRDGVKARLDEMIKEQETIEEMLPDLIGFGYEVQKTVSHLYMVLKSDRLLEVFRRAKAEAEAEARNKAAKEARAATTKARKEAEKRGAIMTLGDHVATPTRTFREGFTASMIKSLPEDQLKDIEFDKDGKLVMMSLNGKKLQELTIEQNNFLMSLLEAAVKKCDPREKNNTNFIIEIYLPKIFREWEIDPRPHDRETKEQGGELIARDKTSLPELRMKKFVEFLRPLDNMVGIVPGEGYYSVARFLSWDQKAETISIAAPYIMKIAEMGLRESAISSVFHANIMTESPASVEIANRIAGGLIELGVTNPNAKLDPQKHPDAEVARKKPNKKNGFKWEATFKGLISECPQLQKELNEIRNEPIEKDAKGNIVKGKNKSQRINKKLQDRFSAAIRIILEKSDVPEYYLNLKIEPMTNQKDKKPAFICPKNSTLNDKMTITHEGKNPKYTSQK